MINGFAKGAVVSGGDFFYWLELSVEGGEWIETAGECDICDGAVGLFTQLLAYFVDAEGGQKCGKGFTSDLFKEATERCRGHAGNFCNFWLGDRFREMVA